MRNVGKIVEQARASYVSYFFCKVRLIIPIVPKMMPSCFDLTTTDLYRTKLRQSCVYDSHAKCYIFISTYLTIFIFLIYILERRSSLRSAVLLRRRIRILRRVSSSSGGFAMRGWSGKARERELVSRETKYPPRAHDIPTNIYIMQLAWRYGIVSVTRNCNAQLRVDLINLGDADDGAQYWYRVILHNGAEIIFGIYIFSRCLCTVV